MPGIFVSYAHEDERFVDRLEKDLVAEGFEVWRDTRKTAVGERGVHGIEDGQLKYISQPKAHATGM